MDLLPHADFTTDLVTLWAIWHARRKALHEQTFQTPHATHHFVHSYIRELQACRPKKGNAIPGAPAAVTRQRWSPPQQGFAKIKVDEDVARNSNEVSYSAVFMILGIQMLRGLRPGHVRSFGVP